MNATHHPNANESEERQAKALYDYMRGLLPPDAPDVPAEEARLSKALRSLAEDTNPSDQFSAGLQSRLLAQASRNHPKAALGRGLRTMSWAAALIILFVGIAWVIRTSLPAALEIGKPGVNGAPPAAPTVDGGEIPGVSPKITFTPCPWVGHVVAEGDTLWSIAATYDVTVETILSANNMKDTTIQVGQVLSIPACGTGSAPLIPTDQVDPEQVYSSPLLPDMEIVLPENLPESPTELEVYEQVPWGELTLEDSRQAAERLGLIGKAFKPAQSNPGDTAYTYTDGFGRIDFTNSLFQYLYRTDYSAAPQGDSPAPLTEAQIAEIETQLKDKGLLDFPYQVEQVNFAGQARGMAAFVQTLDGYALRYSSFTGPRVSVETDSKGKIKLIDGSKVDFKALGKFGIRTAEDAWQKAVLPETPMGVELNITKPLPSSARWQRSHPMGQNVDVYGNLEILIPVEASEAAQIFLESVPLRGKLEGMVETGENQRFIKATGHYEPGENGERIFLVESWEPSKVPLESIIGLVENKDSQVYLQATDRKLRLVDVPDDLLYGMQVLVTGVVLEEPGNGEPLLDWSWIQSKPFGGGGGGGGVSFLDLNLSGPPAALPTPYPGPKVPAGQRLEGETGNPIVTIREYEDGSRRIEAVTYIAPSESWPDGLYLQLQGSAVRGIEAFHMLPVRIWGTLTGKTAGSIVYLDLERFEPVYPEVRMQAWIGKVETATVDEKKVSLLNAQDGQKYVINTSLQDENRFGWMLDDETMIFEGAVFPDQTFGGYPILQDQNFLQAGGIKDLSEYNLQLAVPQVVKEKGTASQPRRAEVEKIELVYHTTSLSVPGDPNQSMVYIQPMWRFVGHYPDGTLFEILVQALEDKYLKPWE